VQKTGQIRQTDLGGYPANWRLSNFSRSFADYGNDKDVI
jgi:hypothetical protein